MNTTRTYLLGFIAISLLSFGFTLPLQAGPSTSNPERLFAVRSNSSSQDYWDRANEAFSFILKVRDEMREAKKAGSLTDVAPRDLGEAHIMCLELEFCSKRLQVLGEPLGKALQLLATESRVAIFKFIEEYLDVPGVRQSIQNGKKKFVKVAKKEVLKLKKLQAMAKKGNWKELDETVHEIELNIGKYLCWMPAYDINKTSLAAVFAIRKEYIEEITEYYMIEADNELTMLRDRNVPDFNRVLQSLNAATKSVESSGDVSSDGNISSGPEWLSSFVNGWKMAHAAAIRVRGIEVSHTSSNQEAKLTLAALQKNQRLFTENVYKGIGALISADTKQCTELEAQNLYKNYLSVMPSIFAFSTDTELQEPIKDALSVLARKSSDFGQDVEVYEDSVGDLLRWQKRKTDAQVRAMESGEYVSLAEAFRKGKNAYRQRGRERDDNNISITTFVDVIGSLKNDFLNKLVVADDLLYSKNKGYLQNEVKDYLCANVAMPKVSSEQVAGLYADLQATEASLGPLSLEAVMALYRVEQNDYFQVGGEVVEIELEGRVTQFSNCEPGDLSRERLYPFKDMTVTEIQSVLEKHTTICYIRPYWVRSKYFLVNLE